MVYGLCSCQKVFNMSCSYISEELCLYTLETSIITLKYIQHVLTTWPKNWTQTFKEKIFYWPVVLCRKPNTWFIMWMVIWYLESSENWQTRNSWSWGKFRSWSYESSLTPGVVRCCFIEFNATRQSYLVMAEAGVKSRIHRYRIGFLFVFSHRLLSYTYYIYMAKPKNKISSIWLLNTCKHTHAL